MVGRHRSRQLDRSGQTVINTMLKLLIHVSACKQKDTFTSLAPHFGQLNADQSMLISLISGILSVISNLFVRPGGSIMSVLTLQT